MHIEIENNHPTIISTDANDDVTGWEALQQQSSYIKSSYIKFTSEFQINFWYKNHVAYTSKYDS